MLCYVLNFGDIKIKAIKELKYAYLSKSSFFFGLKAEFVSTSYRLRNLSAAVVLGVDWTLGRPITEGADIGAKKNNKFHSQ